MNIVRLANTLMKQIPMDPDDRTQLETEANTWYFEQVKKKPIEEITNPIMKFLKQYGELWYVKYAIAVSYLYFQPLIRNLIHPEKDEDYDAND